MTDNVLNEVSSYFLKPTVPSWTKKYKQEEIALINSATSLTLLNDAAPANKAGYQELSKQITIPNGSTMHTSDTLTL
eukprot:13275870-Ditylum_brightwellii.AAC.1